MDPRRFTRLSDFEWRSEASGPMHVPVVVFADEALLADMDDKVLEQAAHVAALPGIVNASYCMPDGHWGYGFPIGGVAAFDASQGGVVSAGGVGFDISCGVRCLLTGLKYEQVEPVAKPLADALFREIPAGLGSKGRLVLDAAAMEAMLARGASWAVGEGHGVPADLARIEERGAVEGADPGALSARAKARMREEMGTLGSGNHYLEVQRVVRLFDAERARGFGLAEDDVVVSIHCGSRGLGHQVATEFLKEMTLASAAAHIPLPDRELASAPIASATGRRYLGAMRAAINCALANRQVLTALCRRVFARVIPGCELSVLYDVSHNTCKEEVHDVDGRPRTLFVHRKGATRAFGPGHPDLPRELSPFGQPVLVGGSMGTASYVLAGTEEGMRRAWGSACHGAGRRMSRSAALKQWNGRAVVDDLARRGIHVRSPSLRGVAEEAPLAYKDVTAVVDATEHAGLARKVARLEPIACVKG